MIARAIAVAASVALLAACGEEAPPPVAVRQPADCVSGIEPVDGAPAPDDVVMGDAFLVGLREQQRLPWREHWIPRQRTGVVKVPAVVPAGETLTLTVPPPARGVIGLDYARGSRAARRAVLAACRGRYPAVFFPGRILVARPVCRAPLDYRYGTTVRGRVRLSFGPGCRR